MADDAQEHRQLVRAAAEPQRIIAEIIDDSDQEGVPIPDEARRLAFMADLHLYRGARYYTKGPAPCAVEYAAVPGERRGRVATGTEVTVLGAKVHRVKGNRYVAIRIESTCAAGYGWINICRERTRFVVPREEGRPRDNPRRSRPY